MRVFNRSEQPLIGWGPDGKPVEVHVGESTIDDAVWKHLKKRKFFSKRLRQNVLSELVDPKKAAAEKAAAEKAAAEKAAAEKAADDDGGKSNSKTKKGKW